MSVSFSMSDHPSSWIVLTNVFLYVSKDHLYMLEEIFLNNMYAIMMWWYILNDCNLWLHEKFRNYMVNKFMVNG